MHTQIHIYEKNLHKSIEKILELGSKFGRVAGYQINT